MATPTPYPENPIDEAVDETFPASDPPSWSPMTGASIRPASSAETHARRGTPITGPHEKDPVCGAYVDEARAAGSARYGGHTYFFCSDACRQAFERDPRDYVAPADARPHPSP